MLTFFDRLVEVNFTSAAVRMLLAVLCGGIIGMERTYKRRAAGFRTHILICLGAAMTAAVGTGHFSSFEEACGKAVRFRDEVVEPIAENSRRYEEYYQVYRNLYGCNKELFWRLPL